MTDTVASVLQQAFPTLDIPVTGQAYRETVEATITAGPSLEAVRRLWPDAQAGERVVIATDALDLTAATTSAWGLVYGGATPNGSGGSIPQQSGAAGFRLASTQPLTGAWRCEISQMPNSGNGYRQFYLQVARLNNPNYYFLRITQSGGGLQIHAAASSDQILATPAYSATSMRWLQIRKAGTSIVFETGPDGVTWSQRASTPVPAWLAEDCRYDLTTYTAAGGASQPVVVASSALS